MGGGEGKIVFTLPDQKELEREIGEYLTRKYGERVKIVSSGLFPMAEAKEGGGQEGKKATPVEFAFDLKPEELVAYLDEYVVQQAEAKDVLATKICTHFNRIRYSRQNPGQDKRTIGRIKNNILLIGPTGVGKTFLIKLIAQRLGVPFVKGDATKFSETGYVGGDVEDLVRELVKQADGDIERAEVGIIYLDEVDKIAGSGEFRFGAEVSRAGVQRALLKPMEETEVELKVPHDPVGQLEALERFRATGKRERQVINTKNILFIMSGAFGGLEELVRKRVQRQGMGFEGNLFSKQERGKFLGQVKAEDLVEYGLENEFVGRLPVTVVLDELTEKDLCAILSGLNSAVVITKKQDFRAYGISILFADEALRAIAQKAAAEQTGARGLVSVMERVLLPFEKKLPSTAVRFLTVTVEVVNNPQGELARLLAEPAVQSWHEEEYRKLAHQEEERLVEYLRSTRSGYLANQQVEATHPRLVLMARQCQSEHLEPVEVCDLFINFIQHIRKWERKISERCNLAVEFDEEAIDWLLAQGPRSLDHIDQLCEARLHTWEYGLSLMSQKKKATLVVITAAGMESPDQFINDLVEKSFKM